MRISDWSSDVCSSDLIRALLVGRERTNDRFPQAEGRGPALSSRHPIVPNSSFPRVKAGCRQIGRASCRESVCQSVYISVVDVPLKKKKKQIHELTKYNTINNTEPINITKNRR